MPDVDPRILGVAVGALAVLLAGGWLVKRFFFTAPSITRVEPAQAEMGQVIAIHGTRFRSNPADDKVWFGNQQAVPSDASDTLLHVRVPPLAASGPVGVAVETSAGRSRPASLVALAPLRVSAVDPGGGLPGDALAIHGNGFAEGATVTIGGVAATVKQVEPQVLQVEMPKVEGAKGKPLAVVVTAGGRSAPPVQVYLGRLPLVSSIEPARGVAGDVVRVHGAGFSGPTTSVRFDGQPALVAAGDDNELLVIVPAPTRAQAEALVPVVVEARGKATTDAPGFTVQRLVEGAWIPRFVAGVLPSGGVAGQATVGTDIAPLLLLSTKDESRSTAERALAAAKALDAAVDRARVGQSVAFEAREQPEVAVALVGAPDRLLKVLPQDAAAYEAPPGVPARGAPPTPIALARHWAALLNDTVAIGTSGAKPAAMSELGPPWSTAFAQLRAALPWQYGSGVQSARVAALSADLRARLREAALRVP